MQFVWQNKNQQTGANSGNDGSRVPHNIEISSSQTLSERPDEARLEKDARKTELREQQTAVADESKRERRSEGFVPLEKLDENVQANLIGRIDVDKSIAEQPEGSVPLLDFSLTHEVIPLLLDANIEYKLLQEAPENPNALENAVSEAKKTNPEKFIKWDKTAEASFQKMLASWKKKGTRASAQRERGGPSEGVSKSETTERGPELYKKGEFAKSHEKETPWSSLLPTFSQKYEEAKALRDTPPSAWETTKGIAKDTAKWIWDHKVTVSLAVGGFFAARWLMNKLLGDDEDETENEGAGTKQKEKGKSGGIFSKWMKRLVVGGVGLGAVCILTKILPIEKAKEWLENLWGESGIGKLFGGKEKAPTKEEKHEMAFYEKVASTAGIEDPELVDIMEEYDYENFMSFTGQTTHAVAGKIKNMFAETLWGNIADADIKMLPDSVKKYVLKMRKQPEKIAAAEDRLRGFLRKHEAVIKNMYPKKNVKDVLNGLAREGVFGEELMDRPLPLTESQVPVVVQTDIASRYLTTSEQNKARSLSLRVFERQKEQQENIFGEKGLIRRLEIMAQKDPSVKEKIEDVRRQYQLLEEKRNLFHQQIQKGVSSKELEVLAGEIETMQEEFETAATKYYAETQGKISGWGYLAFFVARYTLLSERKRAVARTHLKDLVLSPIEGVHSLRQNQNPVKYLEETLREAKEDLSRFEAMRSSDIDEKKVIERQKRTRVEFLERKLELAKLKGVSQGAFSADELEKWKTELLESQKKTVTAHIAAWEASVERLKKAFESSGAELNDLKKVDLMRSIQREKKVILDALAEYEGHAIARAKELGELSDAARAIMREAQGTLDYYRELVKTELPSFLRVFWEGGSGVKKEFIEYVRMEHSAGFTKIVRSAKGHIGIMSLLLIPSLYGEAMEIKEKNPEAEVLDICRELGPAGLQVLVDAAPIISAFGWSDWYTVWTGREIITKKEVHGWGRASRILWGTAGAFLDAASLIPAVDLVGIPANLAVKSARAGVRGAREMAKISKMWPRIKTAAVRVGGWKKFMEHVKNFAAAETKMQKTVEAVQAGAVAAPRLATAGTLLGASVYAIYSMGDDPAEAGFEVDPKTLEEIEKYAPLEEAPKEKKAA